MSSIAPPAPATTVSPARPGFIVSPLYDLTFFVLAPLLWIGIAEWSIKAGISVLALAIFSKAFTHAHLVIVFLRSHGNREIFLQHRVRFIVVPVILLALISSSTWMAITAAVIGFYWDIYHSAQQTFGLARIYDRLAGNGPETGRTLDRWLNHVIYAGPILAGTTFLASLHPFDTFGSVGWSFLTFVPAYSRPWHAWITLAVLGMGIPFLCYYVIRYAVLVREGYRVSWQKVVLLVATGFCSISMWGFSSMGLALIVVNGFHATQYFALVSWTERKTIGTRLGRGADRFDLHFTALVLIALGFAYGLWIALSSPALIPTTFGSVWIRLVFGLSATVSLLHFWFDGFIWSVRKKQV